MCTRLARPATGGEHCADERHVPNPDRRPVGFGAVNGNPSDHQSRDPGTGRPGSRVRRGRRRGRGRGCRAGAAGMVEDARRRESDPAAPDRDQDPRSRAGAVPAHDPRIGQAACRIGRLYRMGGGVLRLLRRSGPAQLRQFDSAGRPAPDQFYRQGALWGRGGHRALQLSPAPHGLEGGPRPRGRKHGRVQTTAPEPALQPAAGRMLRRTPRRRGQRDHRGPGDRRAAGTPPQGRSHCVHRLGGRGPPHRGPGWTGTEESEPRVGQRRPVHRVRRCRPRRRRAGRRLGPTAQRRAGVHVIEADLSGRPDRAGIPAAAGRSTCARSPSGTRCAPTRISGH